MKLKEWECCMWPDPARLPRVWKPSGLGGDGRALCSTRLTGSRMPREAPLKLHSICEGRGDGAFQAPPFKTVLEKCIRWSDFYVSTLHMLSTGAAGRDVRVNMPFRVLNLQRLRAP